MTLTMQIRDCRDHVRVLLAQNYEDVATKIWLEQAERVLTEVVAERESERR